MLLQLRSRGYSQSAARVVAGASLSGSTPDLTVSSDHGTRMDSEEERRKRNRLAKRRSRQPSPELDPGYRLAFTEEDGGPCATGAQPHIVTAEHINTAVFSQPCTPSSSGAYLAGALMPFPAFNPATDALCNSPADILAQDHHAIFHAVTKGHREILRLLLQYNAPVNVRDSQGRTPLHLAVLHDREALAKLLLQHGADVNTRDSAGRTALHYAIDNGLATIVAVLLAYGAQMQ
ncbi:hypothetical protein VTI74DRAFT_3408 [Chaetomium olivicolor]